MNKREVGREERFGTRGLLRLIEFVVEGRPSADLHGRGRAHAEHDGNEVLGAPLRGLAVREAFAEAAQRDLVVNTNEVDRVRIEIGRFVEDHLKSAGLARDDHTTRAERGPIVVTARADVNDRPRPHIEVLEVRFFVGRGPKANADAREQGRARFTRLRAAQQNARLLELLVVLVLAQLLVAFANFRALLVEECREAIERRVGAFALAHGLLVVERLTQRGILVEGLGAERALAEARLDLKVAALRDKDGLVIVAHAAHLVAVAALDTRIAGEAALHEDGLAAAQLISAVAFTCGGYREENGERDHGQRHEVSSELFHLRTLSQSGESRTLAQPPRTFLYCASSFRYFAVSSSCAAVRLSSCSCLA